MRSECRWPCAAFLIVLPLTLLSAYEVNPAPVHFLFQRSLYLTSLTTPGGWWANPALLAELELPTFILDNVTPLGDEYVIASTRFCFPVGTIVTGGVGVLGAGPYRIGSSSGRAGQGGFTASGHFIFDRPSVEMGAGARLGNAGTAGILGFLGSEVYPASSDGELLRSPTVGLGAGWIGPGIGGTVFPSLFVLATGHFGMDRYWEYDGKLGLRFAAPQELVAGSIESTFSLGRALSLWYSSASAGYQVIKLMTSTRIMGIGGALLGFSSDLKGFRESRIAADNGNCVHLGVELRRSRDYRFFGGYEMGVNTMVISRIVHRLWFGYGFARSSATAVGARGPAGYPSP